MVGIGNKIKEAFTPGHKQGEAYETSNGLQSGTPVPGGDVDNTSTRNLLSQPNSYPHAEGVSGTENRIGTNNPGMYGGMGGGVGSMGGVAGERTMAGQGGMERGAPNTGMGGTEAGVGMDRGAMRGTGGVGGVANTVAGDTVCNTRTFTEVEDRPIMRERVERIVEHRPVEKQFVVETRPVGERELAEQRHFESAGVREYEVDRVEGTKCPTTTEGGNSNAL